MTEELPGPPIPANIDVRTFDDMPLNVVRLLNSDTVFTTTPAEFKAAVILWARAWHQVPAGSLPSNEAHLAQMAGLGTDTRGWKRVREGALRGFILCSDGRLYHEVICEAAMRSWDKKTSGACGAEARWKEHRALKNNKTRNATAYSLPDSKTDGEDDGKQHGKVDGKTHGKTMPRTEQNRIEDISIGHSDEKVNDASPRQRGTPARQSEVDAAFERWWLKYPRRVAKGAARNAYARAWKKTGGNESALLAGVEAYARERDGQDQTFTKHPATWLNSEAWSDETASTSQSVAGNNGTASDIATVVPGYAGHLQISMAKKYLMVWDRDGDRIVFKRPKKPAERTWPYRNPETNELFPPPGQVGCPISATAMARAVDDLEREFPGAGPALADVKAKL